MNWLHSALTALREGGEPSDARHLAEDASTLQAVRPEGLELSHLGRYLVVATLVTVCGLLFAWSRIEMVEISSDLGGARTQLSIAQAESARLDLELAALTDPAHLSRAAADLALTSDVPVVDVPPAGAGAE